MNTPPDDNEARNDLDDLDEVGPEFGKRPLFLHTEWMVGIVLVLAVVAIFAGLRNPVWWLVGSPFILTLAVYLWVRFVPRK